MPFRERVRKAPPTVTAVTTRHSAGGGGGAGAVTPGLLLPRSFPVASGEV